MAKAKIRRFRRRYRAPKYFTRKKAKPRLSILTGVGMIGGACASFSGGDSLLTAAQKVYTGADRNPENIANTVIRETMGYDYMAKRWTIPSFTVGLIGGAVASKIAGKYIKPQTFDAIPYVGKHLKM